MNSAMQGGGIHAINSEIRVIEDIELAKSSLSFVNNSAASGGGLSLEGGSRIQGPLLRSYEYIIRLTNNTAQKGGAIYINDYTNVGTCNDTSNSPCFLQTPSFTLSTWKGQVEINSNIGKNTIHGGLLDRCITRGGLGYPYNDELMNGLEYLKEVTTNTEVKQLITSEPVRVCYCNDGMTDCTKRHSKINVMRGETFNVTITAVDQVENYVNATIFVRKNTLSSYYHLERGQEMQKVTDKCSNLTLNLFSPNESLQLILYASGPCNEQGISKAFLEIHFLNCVCPIGFKISSYDDCQCDCDPLIKPHITKCNESTDSLVRQTDVWINYINETGNIGYIIYPNCPYDNCRPGSANVTINLNIPNGADSQCAFGRTGLLCSECKPNLSLSLGSSQCISCPGDWPKYFVIILFGAVLSGVVLVAVILLFNLTVAVGTLNGLIFYVNIAASNSATYLPLMARSKPLFVFLSWLNLELGIDVCFYKGMDTYSKVWLQFLFPTYLIGVLLMVIVIGKYSSRFAKFIGKRNPIATLATLILISYTKSICNITDIFSAAVLSYPDGSHRLLWMPNVNIKYLQGRHIPLFLIAMAVVIIGLTYTVLLFSWQWILHAPNYVFLRWIRNTKLNLFMEANVAAFKSNHRYWPGLLLLIRVALYLVIAYNNSYEFSTSVSITGFMAACLLLLKVWAGNIYKKRLIDCLDSFCYFNLLTLSVAQLYCQATHNEQRLKIAVALSVSISFLLFLGVSIFHIITTLLKVPFLRKVWASFVHRLQNNDRSQSNNLTVQAVPSQVIPTSTEVELSKLVTAEKSTTEIGEGNKTTLEKLSTQQSSWELRDSLREPLLW